MSTELSQQYFQVGSFLDAVEPMLPAYRHGLLSYVAIVHEGEPVILRAAVKLSMEAPPLPRLVNQTANLRVGQRHLQIDPGTIESWIRAAVSRSWLPISTDPLLKLLPDQTKQYSASHESSPPSHTLRDKDPERLWISGARYFDVTNTHRKALDRELAEIGFESVDQLTRTLGLGVSDGTSFEVCAGQIARLESASIQGTQLQIVAQLARTLDRNRFKIIVRNADPSDSLQPPHVFSGSDLDWTESDGYWIGSLHHEFQANTVVICRAVYAGRVQDEVRLRDPHALPNPRRMMLDIVDPGLDRLQTLLTRPTGKQRDDFETAVALLFQMLGFAPASFGKLSGMTHEPDIFVAGIDDEMLVVECTTDVPDDDKLMKLVSRTARARNALTGSSTKTIPSVLPVLVVPLNREELAPIHEKADAYEVLVLSRPEIEAAIRRTEFTPDARETLRQWRNLPLLKLLTHGLDGRQ